MATYTHRIEYQYLSVITKKWQRSRIYCNVETLELNIERINKAVKEGKKRNVTVVKLTESLNSDDLF